MHHSIKNLNEFSIEREGYTISVRGSRKPYDRLYSNVAGLTSIDTAYYYVKDYLTNSITLTSTFSIIAILTGVAKSILLFYSLSAVFTIIFSTLRETVANKKNPFIAFLWSAGMQVSFVVMLFILNITISYLGTAFYFNDELYMRISMNALGIFGMTLHFREIIRTVIFFEWIPNPLSTIKHRFRRNRIRK